MKRWLFLTLAIAFFAIGLTVTIAQGPQVTDDQVNDVARKLYCPVCENIPLDTCGTAACAQWRDEIRIQLASGRTPQQVIDDFVNRFGDRVVGTPQDPLLRALSLVVPLAVSVLAIVAAVIVFRRWQTHPRSASVAEAKATATPVAEDDYRARLEQDLAARR